MIVAGLLDEWRSHVGRGRARLTSDACRFICENDVKPGLGRVKLAPLRPLHIERFMTAQAARGRVPRLMQETSEHAEGGWLASWASAAL